MHIIIKTAKVVLDLKLDPPDVQAIVRAIALAAALASPSGPQPHPEAVQDPAAGSGALAQVSNWSPAGSIDAIDATTSWTWSDWRKPSEQGERVQDVEAVSQRGRPLVERP